MRDRQTYRRETEGERERERERGGDLAKKKTFTSKIFVRGIPNGRYCTWLKYTE